MVDNEALKKIEAVTRLLSREGYGVSKPVMHKFHYSVDVQRGKNSYKVLIYFGKKGIKTVIQGDEFSDGFAEFRQLVTGEGQLQLLYSTETEPERYIGSDESGKGDFFGPLAVCAVYTDKITSEKLVNAGVRDSKLLTSRQINETSVKIREIINDNYALVTVSPRRYNELFESMKNINSILAWAHRKAITQVQQKSGCDTVIIDKFMKKGISLEGIKIIELTKAERFPAVAAASILARSKIVDWFHQQKQKGISLPKGASPAVESAGTELVKKHGRGFLGEVAKLHFKNYSRLF